MISLWKVEVGSCDGRFRLLEDLGLLCGRIVGIRDWIDFLRVVFEILSCWVH